MKKHLLFALIFTGVFTMSFKTHTNTLIFVRSNCVHSITIAGQTYEVSVYYDGTAGNHSNLYAYVYDSEGYLIAMGRPTQTAVSWACGLVAIRVSSIDDLFEEKDSL